MYSLMDNEVLLLTKGFPTLIAFKGFLSTVDILMFDEVLLLGEGSTTLITFKWFLSCVNLFVLAKIGFAIKGFPTFFTRIGFVSGVVPRVFGETWILNRNAVTFLRLMVLVKNQVSPLAEDFPTFMTFIGFLYCMAFQMHIKG